MQGKIKEKFRKTLYLSAKGGIDKENKRLTNFKLDYALVLVDLVVLLVDFFAGFLGGVGTSSLKVFFWSLLSNSSRAARYSLICCSALSLYG